MGSERWESELNRNMKRGEPAGASQGGPGGIWIDSRLDPDMLVYV